MTEPLSREQRARIRIRLQVAAAREKAARREAYEASRIGHARFVGQGCYVCSECGRKFSPWDIAGHGQWQKDYSNLNAGRADRHAHSCKAKQGKTTTEDSQ